MKIRTKTRKGTNVRGARGRWGAIALSQDQLSRALR